MFIYHSQAPSLNQEQADWYNAYRWIQSCRPHTSCKLGLGFRCTHDFCKRHGQFQRIEKANRILSLGEPTTDASAVTLPYGTTLTPHRVAQARRHFLKTMQRLCPEIGCLWRLHFVNFVPHLNMTILGYTNCSKLNKDLPDLIKRIWSESLALISHPGPDLERVYCKPVRSYKLWVDYMFQANKRLTDRESPPKIPYSRWSFHGINKVYKKLLRE